MTELSVIKSLPGNQSAKTKLESDVDVVVNPIETKDSVLSIQSCATTFDTGI